MLEIAGIPSLLGLINRRTGDSKKRKNEKLSKEKQQDDDDDDDDVLMGSFSIRIS
jgi:hypothetical protein